MNIKNRMWLVYAITAGLFWGVWGVVTKLIAEDVSAYMNHVLFTIGMLFTLPFVVKKCKVSTINSKGFLWGLLAGLFAVTGNVAVYHAFSNGGQASIVIPVTNLYPLVTIAIAVGFLKEQFGLWNILGALLAIPAILLLSGEPMLFQDPTTFFRNLGLNSWFLLSLAALVCWGIFSAAQKITTNHISAEWSYAVFIIASVIISVAFIFFANVQFTLSSKTVSLGAAAGILNGCGVLASFAAYRSEGKASAVTTIAGALQPVFTILLAVLFLKENLSGMEAIGILLAIPATLLLSYEKKKKADTEFANNNSLTGKKIINEFDA